jgi:hypothetical protein
MSYPAGNSNWAWEWMGFNPPAVGYGVVVDTKYSKFIKCFDAYYGIGDFDYWDRNVLRSLSDEDKLELIHLLMQDNKHKTDVRKYLGLNTDGTINKSIDEFADSRTQFFGTLTLEECRKQEYPHNQRCRYTTGYKCDDCNNFFDKDSEEYLRTEALSSYDMSIHNIGVYFHREKTELPQDMIDLRNQFDELKKQNCYEVSMEEIQSMITNYKLVKEKYHSLIERGQKN